jgi:uncharacterized protein (DUF433 family)
MEPTAKQYIEVRKNRSGRDRVYIIGTRIRVQDIYVDSRIRGMTPDEIIDGLPHLSLAQVHAALAYYFDNREAILAEIRQDEAYVRSLMAVTGPGPLDRKLRAIEADDAVSSG